MSPMPFNNNQENTRNATSALRDILAPAALEVAPGFLRLNKKLLRVFFVFNYPRFLNTNWFSEVINLDKTLDIPTRLNSCSDKSTFSPVTKMIFISG